MRFIGKAQRAQMHRLLDAVIDRNNTGDATFLNYQAHVGKVIVDCYTGEWNKEKSESGQANTLVAYIPEVEQIAKTIEDELEED